MITVRRVRWCVWMALFAVSLQSCAALFGVTLPSEGELLESASPVGEHDSVGAYVAWRLERPDKADTDVVERTLAFVASDAHTNVVEEREVLRGGRETIIARVFNKDGRLIAAYRGEPGQVGVPLRIITVGTLMQRIESDAKVKELLDGQEAEKAARAHTSNWFSTGKGELIHVPGGKFQCTCYEWVQRVLWVTYTSKVWRTKAPLPLSELVKSVESNTMDGLVGTQELLRFAWKGATPRLSLPGQRAAPGPR